MQGLILAAGMGKRLKELTQDNTKCMVKVNGITLIERALRQLDHLGLSKIVVVIGYEGQKLIDFVNTLSINTEIVFIDNPIYDKTNNIYSLSLAKDYLVSEDTLLLESDLIFEESVLKCLIDDERETLALVDKYESWMDGTCMKVSEDDSIEAFIPGNKFEFDKADQYYKTVNIYKFSKHFCETHYVPFLDAYIKALGENEYYEQVLKVITMLDDAEIKAKKLNGEIWYEIDDIQDLDIASSLFSTDDEKLDNIQARYGGYWRYPKLLDFCYLVNPYYPPKKLVDEMKASFETLLTQYPSGMKINSLLAAKNFNIKQEHIIVGNGAAEIIKSLMEGSTERTGIIRPSFEEYAHRCNEEQIIVFDSSKNNYQYSVSDLIEFYTDNPVDRLVLINPDNPSGNYLCREDVIRLLEWCKSSSTKLIYDESFIDFSDETDATLIDEDIINTYPDLVIVKSISKSYGIPGLRLGVLVSANSELIASMKKDVAIWNINSFGEFYMQIAEKYKKSYANALAKFRDVRKKYIDSLNEIDNLKLIPTQSNFVMAEVSGISSRELTRRLLAEYNIFIKDLSPKTNGKSYIRLAVRTEEDNAALISALKEIFNLL